MQHWCKMANLVFDLDKKVLSKDNNPSLQRIHDKMKQVLEEAGLYIYNPLGEKYSETRTDVEANISGTSVNDLVIKDVLKPVIYTEENGRRTLVQKAVVIAEGK